MGPDALRFDILNRDWLDRGVSWLAEHGAHPYLLVHDWELPQFLARFQSQETLARLHAPPLAYDGAGRIFLFDLVPSPPHRRRHVTDTGEDLRSVPPVAPPQLVLAPPRSGASSQGA